MHIKNATNIKKMSKARLVNPLDPSMDLSVPKTIVPQCQETNKIPEISMYPPDNKPHT